ncbi:response regulator [Nocardioides seonyuensis]|uniref:response regulator n=1 Tax=Nocardioides seonyuensis TaxID=2518371 RepID=UPI001FC94327|nr:response regulator transcription factor [Nocardioides seonyuensis]
MSIRVVVVDDHPLFRDGVHTALGADDDLEVVGEAEDVASAISVTAELAPDVVLMDLNLPDGSGIEAVRELSARHPEVRVLVMTMSTDDDAVVAAMRAGARGFVVKGAGRRDLVESVRAVASGGAVFSPVVADRLAGYFTGLAAVPGREAFPQLTEREREVLELLARGLDNRGIARALFLSDKTVRNHVSNTLAKLEVSSRSEAVMRARNAGLGGVD